MKVGLGWNWVFVEKEHAAIGFTRLPTYPPTHLPTHLLIHTHQGAIDISTNDDGDVAGGEVEAAVEMKKEEASGEGVSMGPNTNPPPHRPTPPSAPLPHQPANQPTHLPLPHFRRVHAAI